MRWLLPVAALALGGCSPSGAEGSATSTGVVVASATGYALDGRDRSAPADAKAQCSADELVTYRGSVIRYEAPVTVHPAFVERLGRFEAIARAVALEVYGREPKRLHHAGAYACRTMPSGRYSEHALGNALDLEGFSFDAEGKGRPAVRIRVADAWRERGSPDARRFFVLLLERLNARDDVFRGIVGPPDPTHRAHLHLDTGPWAYTRVARPGTGS